jgi:hypothetical protein
VAFIHFELILVRVERRFFELSQRFIQPYATASGTMERVAMAEQHVVGALRDKRAELAGMLRQLEQQLVQQRANLAHLDATMRLFDPDIRPKDSRRNNCSKSSIFIKVTNFLADGDNERSPLIG